MDSSYSEEVDKSFSVAVGGYTKEEEEYLIRKGFLKEVDGEWREISTLMDSDLEISTDEEEENCEPDVQPCQTPPGTKDIESTGVAESAPKSSTKKGQCTPRHSMLLRSACRRSIAASNTPNSISILGPVDTNNLSLTAENQGDTTLGLMYKTPVSCRKTTCLQSLSEERDVGIKDVPPVPLSDSVNSNSDSFNHTANCANCSQILSAISPPVSIQEKLRTDVSFAYSARKEETNIASASIGDHSGKEEMLTELDYSAVQSYIHASLLSNVSSDFDDVSRLSENGSNHQIEGAQKPIAETPNLEAIEPIRDLDEESFNDDGSVGDVSFDYRPSPRPSEKVILEPATPNDSVSGVQECEESKSMISFNDTATDVSFGTESLGRSGVQGSSQQSTEDLDDTISLMEKLLNQADELEVQEENDRKVEKEQAEMNKMLPTVSKGQRTSYTLKKQPIMSPSPKSSKSNNTSVSLFATPVAPPPKRVIQQKPSGSHSANVGSGRMIQRTIRQPMTEMKPMRKPFVAPAPKPITPTRKLSSFLDSPARRVPAITPGSARSPLRKPIVSPVGNYIHAVPTPTQVQRMAKPATGKSTTPTRVPLPKSAIPTNTKTTQDTRIPRFSTSSTASPSPNRSRISITPGPTHFRPSKLNSLLPKVATEKALGTNVHYIGSDVKSVNGNGIMSAKKIGPADGNLKSEIIPVANRHLGVRDINNDSLVNENTAVRKFCPVNRFGFQARPSGQ